MKTTPPKGIGSWTPPEECVACEAATPYIRRLTASTQLFRGKSLTVKHHHWECKCCGAGLLGPVDIDVLAAATVAAYQEQAGLLTGAKAKAARESRGWSQIELEKQSGVSRATIARLELGMTVQTHANDRALREALDWALGEEFSAVYSEIYSATYCEEPDPPKTYTAGNKAAPASSAAAFAF